MTEDGGMRCAFPPYVWCPVKHSNMSRPQPIDIDLIKTVQAHLRALWAANSPWVDEHSLRAASGPLRFLLIEPNLERAWKSLPIGGPIQIVAFCFSASLEPGAVGFCGGGDVLPGVPVSIGWGDVRLQRKTLNIGDFLRLPCIYFKGAKISRHQLIKYIANTKGGTHYDPKGLSEKSKSREFVLLRELEAEGLAGITIALNGRNPVHHEVYSIMQSVLQSTQVQRLQMWTA